jgi:hypothetical protein
MKAVREGKDLRGVSKKFGEWYQKTKDTNKLILFAFKNNHPSFTTHCWQRS